MSPALPGGFLTPGQSGKSYTVSFNGFSIKFVVVLSPKQTYLR